MVDSAMHVRRATDDDLDAIVAVGAAALGWNPGDPNAELFRWKHLENPFGRSPIWLAELDGRIAGYRAFMRWELIDDTCRTYRAVRAVDTATHPDFRRRGIFSRLTMHAVDNIAAEGVDLVFNTPNQQSLPGYLKMGWIEVGRLPVAVRVTRPRSVGRILQARTAAEKWSERSMAGLPAHEVLQDPALAKLIDDQPSASGVATPLSVPFLQWRYGLEPLAYRAWAPGGAARGIVLFRVRRRGRALECSIGHVLAPSGDRRHKRRLLSGLSHSIEADYLLKLGAADLRNGFVSMPGQGPRLTARPVASDPPGDPGAWAFELGDIELF